MPKLKLHVWGVHSIYRTKYGCSILNIEQHGAALFQTETWHFDMAEGKKREDAGKLGDTQIGKQHWKLLRERRATCINVILLIS